MYKIGVGKKRAQTIPVVALITAIAIFMMVYLFLMPKEDKCILLPTLAECNANYSYNSGSSNFSASENQKVKIILDESPGEIFPVSGALTYKFDNIDLFSVDKVEFSVEDSSPAEATLFSRKDREIVYPKHQNVNNVQLFLGINDARGDLYVYLNGKKISSVSGSGVQIVDLPVSKLNAENYITLKASKPLFGTNYYKFGFIKVKESYIISQDSLTRDFKIEQDLKDVKSAEIMFDAECLTQNYLSIALNGKNIFSEKVCGKRTVDLGELDTTYNKVTFFSFGNYFLYNTEVRVNLYQEDYPIYYFTVSNEDKRELENGEKDARLFMSFHDDEWKNIVVYINEKKHEINTKQVEHEFPIGSYFKPGANSIRIWSKQTGIQVDRLKLIIEEN
ncbi:hypothetical protein COV15_02640 [Candidatus Woesearchaeota archaeon CG10_big_fil_rev_8_21_14_0_10_34_12]|nr:MAG: hypothetical protein COV15_02640 [Candidatus Woesearchaeota archaeon CG10_big_fil_rev_8_21_14_0_10_34_12]